MKLARIMAVAAFLAAPSSSRASQKDLEIAKGVLEEALKEHPKNAELHTLLGFVFRKMEKLEDAERAFSEAVAANPDKAEAHLMLGMLREKKGLKKEALASWRACLATAKQQGMRETAQRHIDQLEKAAP